MCRLIADIDCLDASNMSLIIQQNGKELLKQPINRNLTISIYEP